MTATINQPTTSATPEESKRRRPWLWYLIVALAVITGVILGFLPHVGSKPPSTPATTAALPSGHPATAAEPSATAPTQNQPTGSLDPCQLLNREQMAAMLGGPVAQAVNQSQPGFYSCVITGVDARRTGGVLIQSEGADLGWGTYMNGAKPLPGLSGAFSVNGMGTSDFVRLAGGSILNTQGIDRGGTSAALAAAYQAIQGREPPSS